MAVEPDRAMYCCGSGTYNAGCADNPSPPPSPLPPQPPLVPLPPRPPPHPPRTPPAPYPAGFTNVVHTNAPGVGGWGGTCTCPDGSVYQVGDEANACASLACVGGISGICSEHNPGGSHVKVVCAMPALVKPLSLNTMQLLGLLFLGD